MGIVNVNPRMDDILSEEYDAMTEDAKLVPVRKERPLSKHTLLNHMSADNLRRLTAKIISKPDLTDAERRLGDYVMDVIA